MQIDRDNECLGGSLGHRPPVMRWYFTARRIHTLRNHMIRCWLGSEVESPVNEQKRLPMYCCQIRPASNRPILMLPYFRAEGAARGQPPTQTEVNERFLSLCSLLSCLFTPEI